MQLLVKKGGTQGFVAHIPGVTGQPLCRTRLNLSGWSLLERPENATLVCYNCQMSQQKPVAK
jgi:hypothetical protein